MARSAHREAVGYFEQALGALPHLPETRDTREQAIDLRLALRSALVSSGNSGRILAYLREAEALAEALDDPRRLARVSLFLSHYFALRGAYDQAIAAAQRALALATAGGDVVLHGLANHLLAFASWPQGDYRRVIDYCEQVVASFDGTPRYERFGGALPLTVGSRVLLAWCHAELGTFAEGRTLGDEGLRIAEEVDHPTSLVFAYHGSGLDIGTDGIRGYQVSPAAPRRPVIFVITYGFIGIAPNNKRPDIGAIADEGHAAACGQSARGPGRRG